MDAKVIGVRVSENQETKVVSSNLFVEIPFSDWESSSAKTVLGSKVDSCYIRKELDCKPGDIVELVYEKGFQDKAILVDVKMVHRHLDDAMDAVKKTK